MAETSTPTSTPLSAHGINAKGEVHWNLNTDVLIDISLSRNEGILSAHGALVTETGERTGRSPNDKYIVDEASTHDDVNWGDVNVSTDLATFERMRAQVVDFLSEQDALFVQDLACGAEPSEALPIRVITHNAWPRSSSKIWESCKSRYCRLLSLDWSACLFQRLDHRKHRDCFLR